MSLPTVGNSDPRNLENQIIELESQVIELGKGTFALSQISKRGSEMQRQSAKEWTREALKVIPKFLEATPKDRDDLKQKLKAMQTSLTAVQNRLQDVRGIEIDDQLDEKHLSPRLPQQQLILRPRQAIRAPEAPPRVIDEPAQLRKFAILFIVSVYLLILLDAMVRNTYTKTMNEWFPPSPPPPPEPPAPGFFQQIFGL